MTRVPFAPASSFPEWRPSSDADDLPHPTMQTWKETNAMIASGGDTGGNFNGGDTGGN